LAVYDIFLKVFMMKKQMSYSPLIIGHKGLHQS